jgi:hypothetical protein
MAILGITVLSMVFVAAGIYQIVESTPKAYMQVCAVE